MTKERRRYKRIGKAFLSWFRTIKIILAKRYPSKWDVVSTRDLSAGGILFSYNNGLKIGTSVQFRIIFPFSAQIIRCIGKIVRCEKPSKNSYPKLFFVAAEFDKIKEKDKELIKSVAENIDSS